MLVKTREMVEETGMERVEQGFKDIKHVMRRPISDLRAHLCSAS